ncbi:MAG TPA: hypothetical protein VGM50_07630 [Gemmatimonadaceae bacterium]
MGRRSTQFVLLPSLTAALTLALAALPSVAFAQGQPPQPPPGQAPPASASQATQQAHQMHDMQSPAPGGQMSPEELNKFAHVSISIASVRDSAQAQLAMVKNKKDVFQQALRAHLATQIDSILKANQMTSADYEHKTFVISTDAPTRKSFDQLVSKITGVPIPATNLTTVAGGGAAAAPSIKLPPGAVGVHIGHVISAFGDTPNMQGLLPVALADAKVAAQHAALAAKDPNNLAAMKLHAGHVLNALDPTIVVKGPGSGYGVKKATQGVITHINLAAKATGASQNVITHANHVATSAQNTLTRCDTAIDLAKKIQESTSASDAAALVSQLVSVTSQLTAGVDKNGDGRITWEAGEGGLQQANEHMKLMLAGEK